MINIAKLLKNTPKGFELYSPLFGKVKFKYINDSKFGIVVAASDGCCRSFDKYGRYFDLYDNAECLLFPSKEVRTWEGWELPVTPRFKVGDWIVRWGDAFTVSIKSIRDANYYFNQGGSLPIKEVDKYYQLWIIQDAKDGDVLVYQDEIFLFNLIDNNSVLYRCCFDGELVLHSFYAFSNEDLCHVHPASKQQRDLLFAKMKEAGYEWDSDKKELKKIQPHYNIKNFQPFDKVLVRDTDRDCWIADLFSSHTDNFHCFRGSWFQCVPFNNETKHLLDTTDMPNERFINW